MPAGRHRLSATLALAVPIAFGAPLALAAAVIAQLANAGSTIVPDAPIEFESLHLRMTVDSCAFNPSAVAVRHDGERIVVTQQPNACLLPGAPRTVDVQLGELPVGRYRVDVYASTDTLQPPSESIAFEVTSQPAIVVFPAPPRPLADYSGIWWNPAKPGFGLVLHQGAQHDAMFGAQLGFDGDGAPSWTTLQSGRWVDATTWEGVLYRTAIASDRTSPATKPVGTVTLAFTDVPATGQASMTTILDGVVTVTPLTRPRW